MASKIEIAEAVVPIIPSARGIKGGIEKELSGEMSSVGVSAGNLLGGQLVGTIKKLVAAAGIGKFIQSAMSEGGKLQQSYGGLDTIYGEASEAAKAYAQEAYRAGISANDYAEQAVSFGASLKQAFAGDTSKAVEAANTAIMDMTDNAAKMGTPLDQIQHAYQGFAKQNYTMLDNLKLGYGGTKTEMERLLADAQKISGVEYNMDNLGDVYEAIHVIQGELGLTGVAADEAARTFTGSMGAMKAAFTNFMGALATGGDITTSLQAVVGNAALFFRDNMLPMLTNIISQIPAILTALAPMVLQGIQSLFTMLSPYLSTQSITAAVQTITNLVTGFLAQLPTMMAAASELINGFVGGLMESLPQFITTAGELVLGFATGVLELLPDVITTAGEMIAGFVGGIMEQLPSVIDSANEMMVRFLDAAKSQFPNIITAAGEAISGFVGSILSNLPAVVDSGINLIQNWVNGMNQNKHAIIQAITEAIKNIVSTIVNNLPQILESGIKILAQMAAGLVQAIPQVISVIVGLVGNITKELTTVDWGSIGRNILEGVAKGLTGGVRIIADAARNAAKTAFDAAKNFLGIESPSKLFRDEVGQMMAEGMAIGFEDNVPTAEIEGALRPMASVVPDAMGGSQYSYGGFTINVYGAPGQNVRELADLVGEQINNRIRQQQAVFA